MSRIKLLCFFLARDFDLLGIDYDDKVTGVNVGRELRLVFASQNIGDSGGETAQGFAFSVYYKPFFRNFAVFGDICLHERLLHILSWAFPGLPSNGQFALFSAFFKEPEALGVSDHLHGQAMRWRGSPGQIAISSGQSLAEALRRSLAEPDFH